MVIDFSMETEEELAELEAIKETPPDYSYQFLGYLTSGFGGWGIAAIFDSVRSVGIAHPTPYSFLEKTILTTIMTTVAFVGSQLSGLSLLGILAMQSLGAGAFHYISFSCLYSIITEDDPTKEGYDTIPDALSPSPVSSDVGTAGDAADEFVIVKMPDT